MGLSIIIVSWNVRNKLRENLAALFAGMGNLDLEIFVVDNNSSDGSVEMVKKEFPQVKLIVNKENLGFAKANNQAIKKAKGEFILLLNPDMQVFPDTLEKIVKWMKDNKQARVATCQLVSERGETIKIVRQFPTVWDQLAIILKLPHIFPGILNKYLRSDFDYSRAQKVDSIRGSFFMIRRTLIPSPSPTASLAGEGRLIDDDVKTVLSPTTAGVGEGQGEGLLDERYFIWFEEVDFCKQAAKTGGQIWYTPVAKCTDYVGQSFEKISSLKKQIYFRDSMLKYFKKWHPVWQYWFLKLAWLVGMAITWAGTKLNIKSEAKT
ncbi:MAG: glycosyltransferase family 2 protein [Patescibacteria group bacterium]